MKECVSSEAVAVTIAVVNTDGRRNRSASVFFSQKLAKADAVVGHRGHRGQWLLVAIQSHRRSRDGHPLWIAGLAYARTRWGSLRQATFPHLLHHRPDVTLADRLH